MNIGLLSILHNKEWDFRPDMAQTYANALKNAIELHLDNDIEKQHGYFLSKKGYQKEGRTFGANFEDKLYVGNIYRVENHLYWNDEELAEDDQIIDVVVVDGPIARDGGGCSYGSKDWRDQVLYANTIPQVVGHLFVINTPGGEAAARNDYEMMINDCREKGKPTVAFVDGMCCSSGMNLASRCDRTIVMNPKDDVGCIGTMAAFWAVAHDTVDQDGYRYVELVGKDCPEKNAWYREAAKGEYEKLQADLDKDTEEFHQTVRENRPLVTDDMLSGKVFPAEEAIPALVDEIGDMERAIECVFQLADETMQAARFMTAPEPEPAAEPAEEPDNQETTHQINNDMSQEEMKAAEAAAAEAAKKEETAAPEAPETPVDEQPAEPAAEPEAPASEETPAEPAAEPEAPAAEQPAEPAAEPETPAAEETPAEPAAEPEAPAEEQPAEPAAEPEAPASEAAIADAQAEIDRISETLRNAEQMIANKDKEIADLKADVDAKAVAIDSAKTDIESLNGMIAEKDATIAERDKTIEALRAEVKELSGKETPMVDAGAGVPAGNGTGEAPKGHQKRITRENMTYEHCREVAKERLANK